ncbi:MAG: prolipoprotein diacylglyceryl transferase [Clostridia bacterium]|nr:prolipoprotein diacylglyceryl transferase [Clostridia bacterium]
MYPYDLFLGLDLYDILIAVGFFAALMFFRFWGDRRNFSAGLQNLVIFSALGAIIGGFGAATLFQAFYNFMESGVFELAKNTGATFYGGLIGGVLLFLLIYFVGGRLILRDGSAVKSFFSMSEIAAGAIALAHGLGRVGCLCAGCCHGAITDAWYGVYNVHLDAKTVPIQLFEALFLFALAGVLTYRVWKGKKGNFGLYLVAYAVWRFLIEYLRTDDRGATVVSFLTPSQLTAILLVLFGIGLWGLEYLLARKATLKGGEGDA